MLATFRRIEKDSALNIATEIDSKKKTDNPNNTGYRSNCNQNEESGKNELKEEESSDRWRTREEDIKIGTERKSRNLTKTSPTASNSGLQKKPINKTNGGQLIKLKKKNNQK